MANIQWDRLNLATGQCLNETQIQSLPDDIQATLENMRQFYERALDDLNVNYNIVGNDFEDMRDERNKWETEALEARIKIARLEASL